VVDIIENNPMSTISKIRRNLEDKNKLIFDFGIGDPMDPTPKIILDSLHSAISTRNNYPRTKGIEKLRSACAGYINRRYNIVLDIDSEIAITNGSKEAIFHLPLALCKEYPQKKYIIYGSPGYPTYRSSCLYTHFKPFPLELDVEENSILPFSKIPEKIAKETVILWCNYPHNPTGSTVNISYLKELYDFCNTYDIIIASDDCYADLWYNKMPHSITEVSLENVISFHSCSKRSGMTGLRSGFMYGDRKIIELYLKHRSHFGITTSTVIQDASITAWSDDLHVKNRRSIFERKAYILKTNLEKKGITFKNFSGGLFLWGKLPKQITDIEYFNICKNNGIIIIPSSFICNSNKYIRIALSPTIEKCEESLNYWPDCK